MPVAVWPAASLRRQKPRNTNKMAIKFAQRRNTPYIAAMSKNEKPLVLFDLVSTITDAGPRYAQAYLDMAEQYNIAIPKRHEILNELGQKTLKEIIDTHSPDLPAEKIQGFMQDCNSACDCMLNDKNWIEQLYPHARETLAALKTQGYTLGLYTGTRKEAALDQLRYHQLEEIFPEHMVRAKDNVADDEKNSDTIKKEQVASLIQSNPSNKIIVVGDSLSDFHAARENNVNFIGFANTPKYVFRFAQAGVKTVFTSYERLPGLITLMTDNAPEKNPAAMTAALQGIKRP